MMPKLSPIFWIAAAIVLMAGPDASALDLENHPGKVIYQKLCTDCHGDDGMGAADNADVDPLIGTRDLESLIGKIERTMPEDESHLCVGDEARLVGEYVYHAFYSEAAQTRGQVITPDITRLTGEQLRNSVSDLIGTFRNAGFPPDNSEPGIKGNYRLDDRERAGNNDFKRENFDRIDPEIAFSYGEGLPALPEGMSSDMKQFNIDWRGSIYARDTGIYEFTIRTRNGVRLYVNESNHNDEPTIDGWVAPDNEIREVKGKVFLYGGRRYPVRLEMFKYKEKLAMIEFLWKPPHGAGEIVPNRVLTHHGSPEVFVSDISLPADDRSYGYERGTTVSRVWLDAVTSMAFEAADHVVEYADELSKAVSKEENRGKRIREFAAEFTARAYRRPLKPGEREQVVDPLFKDSKSIEDSLRKVVLRALTSPYFLYPGTSFDSPHSPWAKASAMALASWDSIPDNHLRKRAAENHLDTPKKLEELAWRMQWDSRAHYKVRGFFHHWLELSKAAEIAKDTDLYPEFSDEMIGDLRTSLELFIDDIVWSDQSDYRQLLLANHLFLNERLGKIYGRPEVKGSFRKVSLPDNARNGIITHPFLLTSFSYHNNTSPIHRGVFLTRNIVGLSLKPPPEAIEFKDNHFPPNLTMREKVTEMTSAKACMSCHSMINPLGFSLEHYDAIGRWRDKERNKPINDDGVLETDSGDRIEIKGPRDVAEYAANSPAAHEAFVRQLFHHTVKQPLLAYGPETSRQLEESFRHHGHNIRHLLIKMVMAATEPVIPQS